MITSIAVIFRADGPCAEGRTAFKRLLHIGQVDTTFRNGEVRGFVSDRILSSYSAFHGIGHVSSLY